MTAAVLVTAATVRFGDNLAVDGVSVEIPADATFGIVGESGSGKTTLMRAILGLQRLDAGEVRIFGEPLRWGARAMRARNSVMQPIFQDPAASLSPRRRIGALINEVAEVLGEPRSALMDRLAAMFHRLGLDVGLLAKYPHELSGGQARRVAVARALLMRPRILIADEPTAGLDVSVQGDLLNLLQDLRRRDGLTIVVISHNLAIVRLIADHAVVMRRGAIVEAGPADRVFGAPEADYTKELIASWPKLPGALAPVS